MADKLIPEPRLVVTKVCPGCGLDKAAAEFGPRRQSPDGLRPQCKPCRSLWTRANYQKNIITARAYNAARNRKRYAADPAAGAAKAREWRERHPKPPKPILTAEQIAQRGADRLRGKHEARRRTYRKNKEKVLAVSKIYRSNHKDQESVNRKAHYQRNKQRVAEIAKAYREAHPELYAAGQARRRAKKRNATPLWANHDKIDQIYAEADRLTREIGIAHEVDHIVPLQSLWVCGLHCEANLEAVPHAVNRAKSNRRWPNMGFLEFEPHPMRHKR